MGRREKAEFLNVLVRQKTVKSIMLLSEQNFITKHVPFHAETGLLPVEVVSITRVL